MFFLFFFVVIIIILLELCELYRVVVDVFFKILIEVILFKLIVLNLENELFIIILFMI